MIHSAHGIIQVLTYIGSHGLGPYTVTAIARTLGYERTRVSRWIATLIHARILVRGQDHRLYQTGLLAQWGQRYTLDLIRSPLTPDEIIAPAQPCPARPCPSVSVPVQEAPAHV